MKFGNLFEFHKIPEWYNHYLEYKHLCALIKHHKEMIKHSELAKLNGIFFLTADLQVINVPIFRDLPLSLQPDELLLPYEEESA